MPTINITVAEKIATNTTPGVVIVCGNSDYTVTFDLDAEWAAEPNRTARFVYYRDGLSVFKDVAFTGNTVAVPVLSNISYVLVGVYAGDLRTTTPARVLCDRSILCGDPVEQLTEEEAKRVTEQAAMAALEEAKKSGQFDGEGIHYCTYDKALGIGGGYFAISKTYFPNSTPKIGELFVTKYGYMGRVTGFEYTTNDAGVRMEKTSYEYVTKLGGNVWTVNGVAPDAHGNVEIETGGATDEQVATSVADYLAENPVEYGGVKTVNGISPDENGNVEIAVTGTGTGVTAIDYDQNVKAINHRGYSATAPENTIPAYILSKQKGFTYAEADISFTSDGVAVLLHDSTIDRTSNGSGTITEMTYAEVSQYDFGSWKSSAYAGTRIPTFEDFILLCKRIALHPYIELKDTGAYTQDQITSLVETVKAYGMAGKVTWISFSSTFLGYVKNADAKARLGYLTANGISSSIISTAQGLQTDENEVFIDVAYYNVTSDGVALCVDADIPLEVWTVNNSSHITSMNPYITGVTSDNLVAGSILYSAGMSTTDTGTGGSGDDSGSTDDGGDTEATLSSISATYSGGDVEVGTAVTALSGIVVTATYSDGSTATVTDYTLSGTIAEGNNTVTVSYGGKTATITVNGVDSSGGDEVPDIDVTIPISDFTTGGISTIHPYINTGNGTARLSYVGKMASVIAGHTYQVTPTYSVESHNMKYGVQYVDKEIVDVNGTLADNTSKIDSGWQTSATYTFTPTFDAYVWICFANSNGFGAVDATKVTSVNVKKV